MADVFTEKKRSEIMSRIRSKDTKLETDFFKLIRRTLYLKGLKYRKHYKKLSGKPDIAFVKKKVAVFIDGDFWHGYNFGKVKNRLPQKYWRGKIENNIKRDKRINRTLKKEGWIVIRIWGHEIKKRPAKALNRIVYALK
jgi:DNA mismatch endonuclease Vsr